MRVPILTYHSSTAASCGRDGNDHLALAEDLALIDAKGWRVVPLQRVVDRHLGRSREDLSRCVALTCDDGTDLDVRDVDYPGSGWQPSFLSCLSAARDATAGRQDGMHMTSFVIADPAARALMDRECLHGLGWMGEDWWPLAMDSGLMDIGCHSWDHNHPVLPWPGVDGMPRGDFLAVDNAVRAASQLDRAMDYVNQRLARRACRYFAYPYGQASRFLVDDYLPSRGPALGLDAAFGVQGEPVTADSRRWLLPRFVCGWHWHSTSELSGLLDTCDVGG
jgi:peptidoglycan/xylan/chitin deacetylase (PgdA/CDA1 family)